MDAGWNGRNTFHKSFAHIGKLEECLERGDTVSTDLSSKITARDLASEVLGKAATHYHCSLDWVEIHKARLKPTSLSYNTYCSPKKWLGFLLFLWKLCSEVSDQKSWSLLSYCSWIRKIMDQCRHERLSRTKWSDLFFFANISCVIMHERRYA